MLILAKTQGQHIIVRQMIAVTIGMDPVTQLLHLIAEQTMLVSFVVSQDRQMLILCVNLADGVTCTTTTIKRELAKIKFVLPE